MSQTNVVVGYTPVHFPSEVRKDNGKAEMGPFFSSVRIHFLHQAGQLLESSIHPEKHTVL